MRPLLPSTMKEMRSPVLTADANVNVSVSVDSVKEALAIVVLLSPPSTTVVVPLAPWI